MTTKKYIGLNAGTAEQIADDAHVKQSINDILLTPVGSRVMRRTYGSQLSELIDWPSDQAVKLQIMSAIYTAIATWERRVSLTGIAFSSDVPGQLTATLSGVRIDTGSDFTANVGLKN